MAGKATTKSEIIGFVAEDTGLSRATVKNVIDTTFAVIADEIADGRPVTITGFVKFTHRLTPGKKKGDKVRNPFTGEETVLTESRPAKIRVSARALKVLQEAAPKPTSKAGKAAMTK